MPLLISILSAVLIYCVFTVLFPPKEKDQFKRRIIRLKAAHEMDDLHEQVIKDRHKVSDSKRIRNLRWVSKELSGAIALSGIKLTASEYLYVWMGATLIPLLLLFVFTGNGITAIGGAVIGFVIPPFILKKSQKKRQEFFTKQLGEALLIIGNCLKGGFSFRQAMDSIASDMSPPISSEFTIALREMRFGVSQEEALRHMTERVKNRDLDLFVSAVLTSVQVGSNLSEILESISTTIKDRIRIKQEVRVLTSSGRVSAIIISLLPVFIILMIMIINPGYFTSFFESTIGKIMIGLSILLEIIGFSVIRKIADIKY